MHKWDVGTHQGSGCFLLVNQGRATDSGIKIRPSVQDCPTLRLEVGEKFSGITLHTPWDDLEIQMFPEL